jgi:DNA-directed RNA polymerase subunit RPC12/RpoP
MAKIHASRQNCGKRVIGPMCNHHSISSQAAIRELRAPLWSAYGSSHLGRSLAMSDEVPDKRAQFTVEIECPKCGHKGHAIWEKDARPDPRTLPPTLLSLPAGFSERVRTNLTELPEIVCDKCGTVQPD